MVNPKSLAAVAFSLVAAAAAALPASADFPGRHPYYLHALSDLRAARALIDRGSYARGVDGNEDVALDDIARADRAIRAAGFDDGKNVNQPVPVDGGIDRRGRLTRALQALADARADLNREEQNPDARRARAWGIRDVDGAIAAVRRARFDQRTGF